jgi:membrane protease YdiL (CAAX protease family)
MIPDVDLEKSSSWPPRFTDGIGVVSVFLLTFVLITVLTNVAQSWVLGDDPARIPTLLSQIPVFGLTGAIALVALRAEDVCLRDIGVSWKQARIASVVVGGVVITVNVVVLGVAMLAGTELSVGVYPQYIRRLDATTALLFVGAVTNNLFVGPVEELVFRGYLQNKVLDVIDGRRSWLRTGLGILMTAVLFAVVHLPNLLLDEGTALTQALGGLVLLMTTAVLFGFVYELTENLVLVALVHGIGNWWPLVVDPGPGVWPNYVVLLGLYTVMIVLYRRSAHTTVSKKRSTKVAN